MTEILTTASTQTQVDTLAAYRPTHILSPQQADKIARERHKNIRSFSDMENSPELALANDFRAPIQMRLPLFDESRLPYKPYCSDPKEDDGAMYLRIRSFETALRKPYIQINPPTLRFWMCFDIDDPHAYSTWERTDMAPPAWAAIDRETGRGHYAYALSAPVLTSEVARQAPLKWLVAIESAFRERLNGDPSFSGLLTKNPAHSMWAVHRGPQKLWGLSELAEYVDLKKHVTRKKPETVGLARNCSLFESLRHWAYRNLKPYKNVRGGFVLWQTACYNQALKFNGDFPVPLWDNECWHVGKSVSSWTWRKVDIAASDKKFSALQAHRGRIGGLAKGAAYATAQEKACYLRAQNWSIRQIANELNVSAGAVHKWVS